VTAASGSAARVSHCDLNDLW